MPMKITNPERMERSSFSMVGGERSNIKAWRCSQPCFQQCAIHINVKGRGANQTLQIVEKSLNWIGEGWNLNPFSFRLGKQFPDPAHIVRVSRQRKAIIFPKGGIFGNEL